MKWKIEYDNDTGANDDYFREWWTVTDGEKSFDTNTEKKAQWLCDKLNDESPASVDGQGVDDLRDNFFKEYAQNNTPTHLFEWFLKQIPISTLIKK